MVARETGENGKNALHPAVRGYVILLFLILATLVVILIVAGVAALINAILPGVLPLGSSECLAVDETLVIQRHT